MIEPHRVQISRHNVKIPDLPPVWDGLTIAHMTDLHRSPFVGIDYLNECIDAANALRPDLTIFSGDYITHGMRFRNQLIRGDINLGHPAEYLDECADCMGRARAT